MMLERGQFQWKCPPFTTTEQQSIKNFQLALGNIAHTHNVMHFNLPLHKMATEAHTNPGIKHNLLSMNRFSMACYTAPFGADSVSFLNSNNVN